MENDGPCRGERDNAAMEMSKSTTNECTLPSVKRTSISVEKDGFGRMPLTCLGL